MPYNSFLRTILIILSLLQILLFCSCSRTRKETIRDYGTMRAGNVHSFSCCEPVPYAGESPEFGKSVFSPDWTETSPPENAHETQNLSSAKADAPPEDTAEKTHGDSKSASLPKTAPEKRNQPQPAKADAPPENTAEKSAGDSKSASLPKTAPEKRNQPHPAKPDDLLKNTGDSKTNAGTENKTDVADKKSNHLNEMDFYKQYSRKLGMELDGTENRKLIMAVAEWMGTPYLWGGCSKEGVDCSCLIKNIYEKVYGIELRRTSSMMCNADIVPVEEERLREGDIVCFGTKEDAISHVGLYLRDSKFVHASRSGGVRISSLERNYFKKRMVIAGRAIRPLQISIAKLSIRELVVVNR